MFREEHIICLTHESVFVEHDDLMTKSTKLIKAGRLVLARSIGNIDAKGKSRNSAAERDLVS